MSDRYHYKGHPAYLKGACADLGVSEGDIHSRARALLGALDSLAGQCADAPAEHRPGIFLAVAAIRNTYAVMHETAEIVLREVGEKLGLTGMVPKVVPTGRADELEAVTRQLAECRAELQACRDQHVAELRSLDLQWSAKYEALKASGAPKADEPKKAK